MNEEQKELMETAYSYLNKLFQTFDELIENVENRPEDFGTILVDGLDGMKWLGEALLVTHGIHNYKPDIEFLTEQFSVILEGYENRDFAFIAEVIENELMPLLSEWFDIIEEALEENAGE